MFKRKKQRGKYAERRRYVRLETVFPVEFRIYSRKSRETTVPPLRQGFTRNVSAGGMCLEVNELENGIAEDMRPAGTELKLFINMPHKKEPLESVSRVKWVKREGERYPKRCLLGLEYIDMDETVRRQIIGYAKRLRRRPKLAVLGILSLLFVCGGLIWQVHNANIKNGISEKQILKLGKALVQSHEKRLTLANRIYSLGIRSSKIRTDLQNSRERISQLEERFSKMAGIGSMISDELTAEKKSTEAELLHWRSERQRLLDRLEKLSIDKEKLRRELKRLKDINNAKIVRIRLTSGSSITGQLLDITAGRLYVKIGMGSVGIERGIISGIKEVSPGEKIDITKEWRREEEEAQKEKEKQKLFAESQRGRGFVYYNGRWIKKEKAMRLAAERKQKEKEVFGLITSAREGYTEKGAGENLLEALMKKQVKPIISIKDGRIYVNGRMFFIKGVGYGIEYPGTSGSADTYKKVPFSVFENDFKMMRQAGINTIRTYEPLPVKLLDLAEKYGLFVIENVCYPSGNTDFNSLVHLDILKEQAEKYVLRDRNRPCILMWSIWNDAPWAWGAGGNVVTRYGFEKTNAFLKELYNTVKKYDTSHPVTAGNAAGVTGEELGWNFLDVIGLNMYIGGYDWFIQEEADNDISNVKKIEKKYNKPVVILETGFSTFVKGQDQAEVLSRQIKTAGASVSGLTIFQWADGWQKAGDKDRLDDDIEEHWGILDGYRHPKPGYKAVSRLFNSIKTESTGYKKDKI